ncbi:MAG: divergent polysaccharide deacetylase family protein [Bacillota bacterium]
MPVRRIWVAALLVFVLSTAGGAAAASLHFGRTAAQPPGAPPPPPPHTVTEEEPELRGEAAPEPESQPGSTQPAAVPEEPLPKGEGKIAIIIDDMGQNLPGTADLLQIDRPLTFSFLPHTPHFETEVSKVEARGQDVFLHLPMEPLPSTGANPGPDAITTAMTDNEIQQRVRELAATLPGARGANNHMGSLATADGRVMQDVVAALKSVDLPFVDSRTQPQSLGYETARAAGLPAAANSLFIDRERTVPAVKARLRQAALLAQKHGAVIIIGHPHPSVAQAIREMIPLFDQAGIELVFARQLAH